eukprot:TRINITY_DN11155_c0_g1_i1.p1 TRINITY_DN11155_c0_g1~~TRINITY_DN11155_c0_g1_i1.p1  ORF type:complete len:167 (+),score=18.66 TRINITY_DN11155_c0_g1_i1:27-503(+)
MTPQYQSSIYGILDSRRNDSECNLCGGTYTSFNIWQKGNWKAEIWTPLEWVEQKFSPSEVKRTLNPNLFDELWKKALQRAVGINTISEILCRYGKILESVQTLSCDCGVDSDDKSTLCYPDIATGIIGTATLCHGSIIQRKDVTITIEVSLFLFSELP